MSKKIDETGKIYGRLEVLKDDGLSASGQYLWKCRCVCGNITSVMGGNLRKNRTISCGCYNKENRGKSSVVHGKTGIREYRIWSSIKRRCNKITDKLYPRWGGIGIKMCTDWENSFSKFFEDMGLCPSPTHSINRIKGATIYSKETCEWASLSLQAYDQKTAANNTSGRKGVNFDINCGLWVAQINKEGKVYKKRFQDYEEACKYREDLELEHFGFIRI